MNLKSRLKIQCFDFEFGELTGDTIPLIFSIIIDIFYIFG